MSQQEVVTPTSEPGNSLADVAKELGLVPDDLSSLGRNSQVLDPTSPAEQEEPKKEEGGEQLVDTLSSRIQEASEDLYATYLLKAQQDPSILDNLVDAKDRVSLRHAAKLLERNPKLFGASTIDEYRTQRIKKQAGDNPLAQDQAALRDEFTRLRQGLEKSQWETEKEKHKVGDDLSRSVDSIHSENPNLSFGDVVILAKGRMGHLGIQPKVATAIPFGGVSEPSRATPQFDMSLARRMHITEKDLREHNSLSI